MYRPIILTFIILFGLQSNSDEIHFLKSGADSLAARIQLIRKAKKTISFMTYEFEPCDRTTKIIINELALRARQGLKVQFILDNYSINNSWREALAHHLATTGIQLYVYNSNPGPLIIFKNQRNHIKLLIADDESYIVGGRNSRDAYFGLDEKLNYLDHDVLVTGKSAIDANFDFNKISKNYIVVRVRTDRGDANFYKTCLEYDLKTTETLYWASESQFYSKPKPIVCENVRFGADNPVFLNYPHSGSEGLSKTALTYKKSTNLFLDFINQTKESLVIENQYYLPFGLMDDGFKKLRNRNDLQIDIYTNSSGFGFGTLDKALSFAMKSKVKSDAIRNQHIYTLSSSGFLNDNNFLTPAGSLWRIHTKSAVRDSKDVLISSFNIDPRSYNTNLEAAVVIEDCPELAQAVLEDINRLYVPAVIEHFFCKDCTETDGSFNWKDKLKALLGEGFL